jgi:hypothetical protein
MADDFEAIHTWFSLTYANYLCLPRSVLQSMPDEWQKNFVELLEEMDESYGDLDWPRYRVIAIGNDGRFIKDPIPHYNRGRTKIEPHS